MADFQSKFSPSAKSLHVLLERFANNIHEPQVASSSSRTNPCGHYNTTATSLLECVLQSGHTRWTWSFSFGQLVRCGRLGHFESSSFAAARNGLPQFQRSNIVDSSDTCICFALYIIHMKYYYSKLKMCCL